MTRPIPAPVTGALPRAVAALTIALALTWVGWPVWASGSAPDRAALAAEVPWVLGALGTGVLAAVVTGWPLLLALVPLVLIAIPALLSAPSQR